MSTRVAGHQSCCICHPDMKGEADGRPRPPSRKGTLRMPARDRRREEPPPPRLASFVGVEPEAQNPSEFWHSQPGEDVWPDEWS